jgi:hypothetical protein
MMKHGGLAAITFFSFSIPLFATGPNTPARVATLTITPGVITPLHLRPDFDSVIKMPEEVTSVVLGSPGTFKAEHNEGEPDFVYVKPIMPGPNQSNLLINTKSGLHVSLELINDGAGASDTPVDFLVEYKAGAGFLLIKAPVLPDEDPHEKTPPATAAPGTGNYPAHAGTSAPPPSALELEFQQQSRINTPGWTKWENRQIETSVGDVRQWDNQVIVSYSILNPTANAIEIVPPQIQLAGIKLKTKKQKKGSNIIADQLEIRDYRLSSTRLDPGARSDGVVLFDRPNYKESAEKLYLQIAQADKVDQPILVQLPFTPPIAGDAR